MKHKPGCRKGMRSEDPDITTAAVSMVRLQMRINEKRRKKDE